MSLVPGGALQQHLIDSAWKLLYVVLNALDYIQLTSDKPTLTQLAEYADNTLFRTII